MITVKRLIRKEGKKAEDERRGKHRTTHGTKHMFEIHLENTGAEARLLALSVSEMLHLHSLFIHLNFL